MLPILFALVLAASEPPKAEDPNAAWTPKKGETIYVSLIFTRPRLLLACAPLTFIRAGEHRQPPVYNPVDGHSIPQPHEKFWLLKDATGFRREIQGDTLSQTFRDETACQEAFVAAAGDLSGERAD